MLADDDPLVRQLLRLQLGREPGVQVLGEAADSETAVRLVEASRPDVLLLDLLMPRDGGLAVARSVRASAPGTAILVLTNRQVATEVRALVGLGVRGYLMKCVGGPRIVSAIYTIRNGDTCFDPSVAALLGGNSKADRQLPTARELEVLGLVAEGVSTRGIADRLEVCERTVETLVAAASTRLGAGTRAELVHRAHQAGWLA